ncbi:S1 family peptidase [Vibrio metschnikovii]|uniref:S1 family peptidase n=1 Tax=Vibrio metschnikovii TaxID=28172 RepID=UPI001C2F20F8|nr:trypsin-like serine protease [Vibrio metschnikovii]
MKHNILSAVIGTLLLSSSPLMASGTDSDITARIIGGEKAQPNDWPYMVSLVYTGKNDPFCGGTLISQQHVLTAAHCVIKNTADFEVLTNAYNMDNLSSSTRVGIKNIYIHPAYNKNKNAGLDDIAILELTNTVDGTAVERGNHADFTQLTHGSPMKAIGFGNRQHNGTYGFDAPKVLHEVSLPFVSMDECKKIATYSGLEGDGVLCAGQEGKTICQGDSGGPLFFDSNLGVKRQMGITSFTKKGCTTAAVFTNVSHYQDWIDDHIKGLSYQQHKDLGIVRLGISNRTFVFTNNSNEVIELKNPKLLNNGEIDHSLTIQSNSCTGNLAVGQQCEISLTYALEKYGQGRMTLEFASDAFAEGKVSAWLDYDALRTATRDVKNYLAFLPTHKAYGSDNLWTVEGKFLRSAQDLEKDEQSELILANVPRGELSFTYNIQSDFELDSLTIYINDKYDQKIRIRNLLTEEYTKLGYLALELTKENNKVRFVYSRSDLSQQQDSHIQLYDIKHQKLKSDLINEILVEQAKNSGGGGGSIGFGAGLGLFALMWMRRSRQQ